MFLQTFSSDIFSWLSRPNDRTVNMVYTNRFVGWKNPIQMHYKQKDARYRAIFMDLIKGSFINLGSITVKRSNSVHCTVSVSQKTSLKMETGRHSHIAICVVKSTAKCYCNEKPFNCSCARNLKMCPFLVSYDSGSAYFVRSIRDLLSLRNSCKVG